jgi:hypothetical protein
VGTSRVDGTAQDVIQAPNRSLEATVEITSPTTISNNLRMFPCSELTFAAAKKLQKRAEAYL